MQSGSLDFRVSGSGSLGGAAESRHRALSAKKSVGTETWFLSSLFIIRVPFFLLFGFSKGGPKIKRAKGYYSGT